MQQLYNVAQNKLIILYFMEVIKIPLTNPQITRFFLENNIVSYFDLQHYLSELMESKLLNCLETRKKHFYSITAAGIKTLGFFKNKIDSDLKAKIESYAQEHRDNLRRENQITSSYTKIAEGQYIVTCKVLEQDMTILELNLNVTDSEHAKSMCENWLSRAPEIYKDLISSLIS